MKKTTDHQAKTIETKFYFQFILRSLHFPIFVLLFFFQFLMPLWWWELCLLPFKSHPSLYMVVVKDYSFGREIYHLL